MHTVTPGGKVTNRPSLDNERERQDAIRDEIGRLVSELTRLRNPEYQPIVIGWVLAYEWTSVELEQAERFGTGTAAPNQQSGAISRGLFELGAEHWSNTQGATR